MTNINFFDIGLDDNPLHDIYGIVDHLCSNQNITISLNKENGDFFSGKDMIELAYFISEVEPMVNLEATSNYHKTGGDCLVGEMIFTYYDKESEQTTVVKI